MARLELVMPKMGESIIEATILSWTKKIGEEVEAEETVLEIATDKVDSEVPAPADGVLTEILFQEGDVVAVGEVIAVMETDVAVAAKTPASNGQETAKAELVKEPVVEVAVAETVPFVPAAEPVGLAIEGRFYSPLVLNIARKENIPMAELERLPGSGREGRVTKKDILSFVKSKGKGSATEPAKAVTAKATPPKKTTAAPAATQEKKYAHSGNIEVVPMDRMRKLIAKNMVYSKNISAHVTSYVEADVTNLFAWRKKNKDAFMAKYGEKLTFTPLFVQAVVMALREHPLVNSSLQGDDILIKKDINIGIAVALPSDNLIVPVIKNADHLNLAGLAARINDLATRARANKLKPNELEGGTYTVSNVGTFGNVMGTPIIMQPQVAILAVGAIRKLPAVIETPEGDMFAIRQKMFLSHSYDHRVIDGALGGRFVKRISDILEAWDPNMEV